MKNILIAASVLTFGMGSFAAAADATPPTGGAGGTELTSTGELLMTGGAAVVGAVIVGVVVHTSANHGNGVSGTSTSTTTSTSTSTSTN